MKSLKFFVATVILSGIHFTSFSQPYIETTEPVFSPSQKILLWYYNFLSNGKDWIGLYKAGADNKSYIDYKYIEVSVVEGPIEFDAQSPGDYEIRAFYNDGNKMVASYRFRVGNKDVNTTVTTKKPVYTFGEDIIVEFSGFPGNDKDWIGIAFDGASVKTNEKYFYTRGKLSGTLNFNSLEIGNYEVRGFFNDSFRVRASYKFRVGNPDTTAHVKTGKKEYTPHQPITVQFSGRERPESWETTPK